MGRMEPLFDDPALPRVVFFVAFFFLVLFKKAVFFSFLFFFIWLSWFRLTMPLSLSLFLRICAVEEAMERNVGRPPNVVTMGQYYKTLIGTAEDRTLESEQPLQGGNGGDNDDGPSSEYASWTPPDVGSNGCGATTPSCG